MNIDTFEASLSAETPPVALSSALRGLWWLRRGDWDAAHREVQSDTGAEAAWVHALLHRIEGDVSNAAYWYRQAGRPEIRDGDTDREARDIAAALLALESSG